MEVRNGRLNMTQEGSPYDVVIADIEAERDRLNSMLELLKSRRAAGLAGAGMPLAASPSIRPVSEQEISHDTFFQMTIPEAARKYLTIARRTRPMGEIIDSIIKGGLKSSAKDVKNSLRSIISRDGTFVRVNGEWGLAEWYPAMRRDGKKGKPTSAKNESTVEPDQGETVTQRILAKMRETPDLTTSAGDLAQQIGAPVATVRTSLSTLAKEGKVQRLAIGQYALANNLLLEGV